MLVLMIRVFVFVLVVFAAAATTTAATAAPSATAATTEVTKDVLFRQALLIKYNFMTLKFTSGEDKIRLLKSVYFTAIQFTINVLSFDENKMMTKPEVEHILAVLECDKTNASSLYHCAQMVCARIVIALNESFVCIK